MSVLNIRKPAASELANKMDTRKEEIDTYLKRGKTEMRKFRSSQNIKNENKLQVLLPWVSEAKQL